MLRNMKLFDEDTEKDLDNQKSMNRKFHDSFFTALFSRQENLKQLHEAVFMGETVDENDLKQCTIKRVSVSGLYNDLAYYIGNRLIVMFEHQSTINPNMPFRLFLYVVSIYSELYSERYREFYKRTQVNIPPPRFFVVYTGNTKWDTDKLLLSNAFDWSKFSQPTKMELEVDIITSDNVVCCDNVLHDYYGFYSVYHEKYDYYTRVCKTDNDTARKRAIDDAVEVSIAGNNRISDFLSEYKERVISMLNKTISAEEYATIQYEDGFDEGRAEGRAEGKAEGKAETSRLCVFLIGKGREDLLEKIAQDSDLLDQLLEKYKGYY